MTDALPVSLRDLAQRDAESAVDWYRETADVDTANRFVDALEGALEHIARHPRTGSPRYAIELDLPGIRAWRLAGFPHTVFYVVGERTVDVWRVLDSRRDIPSWLTGATD